MNFDRIDMLACLRKKDAGASNARKTVFLVMPLKKVQKNTYPGDISALSSRVANAY